MSIAANVVYQPISATVAGDNVAATVPAAAAVQTAVTGGLGPQGPQGQAAGQLDQLDDVQIAAAAEGQILRYDAQAGQWKNQTLTVNGGNF